jgi:iron complex transport system ATP-binding protein
VTVLAAQGLNFRVGQRALIADASLALRRGEMLGIIGPNGAGKSTLLKLCAGLLRPASGSVVLLGRPLAAWPARERARRLGFLPQHFTPHWDYSVRELLRLGLERGGQPASMAALGVLAEAFSLGALIDRRWSSLSGGERGRAFAATILAPNPTVVLADEPAATLDVGQAAALMARLRAQATGGGAVGVVVHDLSLASRWCDRLLVVAQGRIVAGGPVAAVIHDPALDRAFDTKFERLETADGRVVLALEGDVAECGAVKKH